MLDITLFYLKNPGQTKVVSALLHNFILHSGRFVFFVIYWKSLRLIATLLISSYMWY